MAEKKSTFLQMIRAPFLSSIVSPLLIGTILSYYISNQFDVLNFIIVLIIGICFHTATNVYNDIYDTLQGTDEINLNRNEFSGGSGVIVKNPALLDKMYWIARIALIVAVCCSIILYFRIQDNLRIILIILTVLSAFFSKYYTAIPLKLAYRGWGELSVWFAFGPMAISIAVIGQNVSLSPIVYTIMPIPGISTLSILLIGQIIDFDADKSAGKWGVAVRHGIQFTGILYGIVQIALCANIISLSTLILNNSWPILISLIPYVVLLPKILKILLFQANEIDLMKKAAALNVLLHLIFSTLFIISFWISIQIR
ncbi:MAG: prenyltransferase [Gammaproteobacteria bacterium]|nr:prenyltransferase [Gammaproteobacteria bacterium]